MLDWLKSFFGTAPSRWSGVIAYQLDTSIKLRHPITTPCGSRVTVVSFCVNVHYSLDNAGVISVRHVELWQPPRRTGDSLGRANMFATHTGEAWCCNDIKPREVLRLAVEAELATPASNLRTIILGRHYAERRDTIADSLVQLLNEHRPPEEIGVFLKAASIGCELSFVYTKADGSSRLRKLNVIDVFGGLLRGYDLEDGQFKSFYIDRISDAGCH